MLSYSINHIAQSTQGFIYRKSLFQNISLNLTLLQPFASSQIYKSQRAISHFIVG